MARRGLISLHPNTIGGFNFVKKSYVFFDEIVICGRGTFDDDDYTPGFSEELDKLLEMGVFVDISDKVRDESQMIKLASKDENFKRILKEKDTAIKELKKAEEIPFSLDDCLDEEGCFDFELFSLQYKPLKRLVHLEHLREKITAEFLNITTDDAYCPLLFQSYNTGHISAADIITIAIAGFPVINESIDWQKLYEFKNCSETKLKLLRFRDFAKKLAQQKVTAAEAKEEIEYMLEEYKQHMKLAKIKYQHGRMEGIFLSSLQFVENLIRFKPSEAFGTLYKLEKTRIELLEAELNSPGKEVALLASLEAL